MEGETRRGSFLEVLAVFLRLGLTSFGGPVAHLGYFREEIVARRKWLSEAAYADLVALCQFLPGPASSQVGIALGLRRAGLPGGLAAWLGLHQSVGDSPHSVRLWCGCLWRCGRRGMAQRTQGSGGGGGGAGCVGDGGQPVSRQATGGNSHSGDGRHAGVAHKLGTVGGDRGCRDNRLAFPAGRAVRCGTGTSIRRQPVGGRVLPGCLRSSAPGIACAWAGPGRWHSGRLSASVRQLLPGGFPGVRRGPRGTAAASGIGGCAGMGDQLRVRRWVWCGAGRAGAAVHLFRLSWHICRYATRMGWRTVCLFAIFLPSFLLVIGVAPFWDRLRSWASFGGALRGINAAVVGLLLAALYDPVWTSAIHGPEDFGLVLTALGLLAVWKWPPWLVVALSASVGHALTYVV